MYNITRSDGGFHRSGVLATSNTRRAAARWIEAYAAGQGLEAIVEIDGAEDGVDAFLHGAETWFTMHADRAG